MNHLLYGLSLVIVLNAQQCNENKNTEAGAANTEKPSTTGTEERPAITVQNGTGNEVAGKRWYIISVNGGELITPEGGERPWIELNDERLQGFGGCNNLMGGYTMEAGRITFNEIGSTKKYCPDVQATERSILEMLPIVSAYQVEGGTLTFMQGTNVVAVLKAME